ncbi:hypothetical protein QNH14_04680 [Apirhabdus apintestini]|nr:hypothetical protein QNH14_04680 [Enterobacteriaceae bacterium CA-0114]
MALIFLRIVGGGVTDLLAFLRSFTAVLSLDNIGAFQRISDIIIAAFFAAR